MKPLFENLIARLFRRSLKGGMGVEYAMVLGLVGGLAIAALVLFGGETDEAFCKGGNALGQVTGKVDERCPIALMDDGTTTGVGPEGFEDLYLALEEVEVRRVLLPVKNFDISGMDEVIVETDRLDSLAACYEVAGGQVTCATMLGTISAFDFPPNVVAVGYELLPEEDVRIEMAQPISITLGSRENPAVNKTWDIFAYRPGVPNTFDPRFTFEDHEFLAGEVGEKTILKALAGDFSEEDLLLEITPAEGSFAACAQEDGKPDAKCGLLQSEPSSTTVRTDGVALGYQVFLPRDARVAVSWPLTVSVASTFDTENDRKTWQITLTRPAGEAPAFPELPFADTEFSATTTGWDYAMVALDQDYPSDLMIRMPQTDEGIKVCFQETETGAVLCSPDASEAEASLVVPAGSYSVGVGVQMPEDIFVDFERRATFTISSVDYPDFSEDFDIRLSRPAYVAVFEPTFAFSDHVFPEGSVDWQSHLVEMTGTFNSNHTMVLPEGAKGVKLCIQQEPEADVSCSAEGGNGEVEFNVPEGTHALGFALDLGESEFQPVEKAIAFELRNAKDPTVGQSYALTASRPASEIVFEPDTAAMNFTDVAYPEASEGGQEAQLTALAGTFNTDLVLSIPQGVSAAACYKMPAADKPLCSGHALDGAQNFVVPKGASHIGIQPWMSENIYIEQDLPITFSLGSAETDAYAVPFSLRATRPAVPVKFDPNLGFRDKIFAAGLTGPQEVMVPIEGEITTGLQIIIPQVDFPLRACFIEVSGDKAACSSKADAGEVVLDVPRNSAAVGYKVELPNDEHVDWGHDIAFRVISDADETLEYDVAVAVSREPVPVAFAPTTAFDNIEFAAGTVGTQSVIKALEGSITTGARVVMPDGGHPIVPCYKKTASSSPVCETEAASGVLIAEPAWSAEEIESRARISAAGYRVTLPYDVHEAVDWTMVLRLESDYDNSVGRDYSVRITRPAVPVIWAPASSMQLPDAEFPVRATGARDLMIPFVGEFSTKTDYTIASTGYAIHPCYREIATGDIDCGGSTESRSATVAVDPEWEAIGYRIELPSDLAQEVEKTVQVDLRSAYDPSLSSSQSFRVYREPAPVVFDPTVSFSDRTYTNGETGWQQIMEPLTGDLTTDLELVSDGSKPMRLCVRDSAGGKVRCTTGTTGTQQVIDVPPTAYAIGFAVELPEDPFPENKQTVSFDLRMEEFPSQKRSYTVSTHRPALDMEFSTSTEFSNETLEIGDSGWKTFVEPLQGNFSTGIEWVAKNPGDDLKLCAQQTSGGPIACSSAGAKAFDVTPDTYAIGYSVNVSDEEFFRFQRVAQLRLQSDEARTVGKDFSPTVIRPARPVELPPGNLFGAHTFKEGESGPRTVMATLDGVGNTPMTYTLSQTNVDIRACRQEDEGAPVVCKEISAAHGAQSYAIDAGAYAVGYRVVLPDDPFATFSHMLNLTISSDTVEEEERVYTFEVRRPVQPPIMPADDLFTNQSYAPGTSGMQTVMKALDPKIDTQLSLRKRYSQPDVQLCIQKSRDGTPTCVGEGNSNTIGVVDTDRSWYSVGYRFPLSEDPDEEVSRTIHISLHSEDVPSAKTEYAIGVSRLPMNAVMPDRTFFTDKTYEMGETGTRVEMVELGQTDIDLMLHKAAGQEGLELCYQTSATRAPDCSGGGEGAFSISVSKAWHAIGYKFSLGSSEFTPFDETFHLHLTASDGWSNRVDYEVDVHRPHKEMILPPADLFADVILEETETGTHTEWAFIDESVNTELALVKTAGQPGLQLCRQYSQDGYIACSGSGNSNEYAINISSNDYRIGYRYDAGSSEFAGFDQVFDFALRSRDLETEEVAYNVSVTRPGTEITMPPADFFSDVEFEVGQKSYGMVMKEFHEVANTGLRIDIPAQAETIKACAQSGEASIACPDYSNASRDASFDVSRTYDKIGFGIYLPPDDFETLDHTFSFSLTSLEDESKTQEYTIRAHRPGKEPTLPPADYFTDVILDEGLTGTQEIFKDVAPHINSMVTMTAPMQQYLSLCAQSTSGRNYCSTVNETTTSPRQFSQGSAKFGIAVGLPSSPYEAYDRMATFTLTSDLDPEKSQTYTIRIQRPAMELRMPPADFFADVEFPAGTTGNQQVMKDLAGLINTNMVMTAGKEGEAYYLCRNYEGRTTPYCPTRTDGRYQRSMDFYTTDTQVGYQVPLPSNQFQPYENTLHLTLKSQEYAGSAQDYVIKITRPAAEVALPPETLFADVEIPAGTTGEQHVMADISGMLNSGMTLKMPNDQSYGFFACVLKSGASSPSCSYRHTRDSYPVFMNVGTADREIGFKFTLPADEFAAFDHTATLEFVSNEQPERSVIYNVRVHRPQTEITLPSQTFFQDVDVPVGTTGQFTHMLDIDGLMSSPMKMIMAENADTSAGFFPCITLKGSSTPSCSGGTYHTRAKEVERSFNADDKQIGFQFQLPSNEFQEFNDPLQITLVSTKDASKSITYNIRVRRPTSEITMPPQDLFTDQTFASTDLYYQEFRADLRRHVTTKMRLDLAQTDYYIEPCRSEDDDARLNQCYGDARAAAKSVIFDPAQHDDIGFKINTGGNEFEAYGEELTFTLTSVEDETKSVTYTIKIDRPRSEITMPPADFFADVTFDPTATGYQDFGENLRSVVASRMRIDVPQSDYYLEPCMSEDDDLRLNRCYGDARNGAKTITFDPNGYDDVGFKVHTGNNEFQPFEKTLSFRITAVDDESLFQDYTIRLRRPRAEIAMPSPDLFPDVEFTPTQTGFRDVKKHFRAEVVSKMKITIPAQGFPVKLCKESSGSSAFNCYHDAASTPQELIYNPESDRAFGFSVNTGDNKFQPFEGRVRFTITSEEDPSLSVDYDVLVTRPRDAIAMPPADLFGDKVYASDQTGVQKFGQRIREHITTKVRIDAPAQGFDVDVCRVEDGWSGYRCWGKAQDAAVSAIFDPSDDHTLAFQVNTGDSEFLPFDERLDFRVTSVEDESIFVDYSIRLSRAAEGVMFPEQGFLGSIDRAAHQTGWQETSQRVDGNDDLRMLLPAHSFPVKICIIPWSGGQSLSCSMSAEGAPAERLFEPDEHHSIGVMVDVGSDQAQVFDEAITFTLESANDPSQSRTYTVPVYRAAAP